MSSREHEPLITPPERKKEPMVDPKILETARQISQIFRNYEQPLWVVGSMAIVAHLGKPHRDITHDIDFMCTDEHIGEIVNDLEKEGFIMEKANEYKYNISCPSLGTSAHLIILHLDQEAGRLENAKFSFPQEGFPDETKEVGGVKLRPISFELLAVMKKWDSKKGGKHLVDIATIRDEMKRRGINEKEIEKLQEKVNLEKEKGSGKK